MENINKLILGDNLEILKSLPTESVDLIYLDPPFFSNRTYEVIWGDKGEVRSFEDRFSGGIDHYIAWLKERVIEMHRILKQTGSFYLHCDWHADAYIRVYILDKIFGEKNFRNEIVWWYETGGIPKTDFSRKHDNIFRYSKSSKITFNSDAILELRSDEVLRRIATGNENATRSKGQFRHPSDVFKIPSINAMAKERIGYPTQKPEALLDRIIKASSNEGDIVMDPFVGGGTTIAVADKLNRKWIGIDQSVAAIKVTEARMQKQQDLFAKPFIVQLHKYDYDTLRYKDAFEFESWIVQQFGGTSNTKQRSDLGLDGKTKDNTPIQVKRSDNIGRNVVDNFLSAVQRYDMNLFNTNKDNNKPIGYIIAFSFGRGAIQEVARLRNDLNVNIELVKVEDIVPIAKKPKLIVDIFDKGKDEKGLSEIEFVAKGESDAGVEFYMWDFDYKDDKFNASVMIDKTGTQSHKFLPGMFNVAVKIIDNEGLEGLEIVKLKVNGKIVREV